MSKSYTCCTLWDTLVGYLRRAMQCFVLEINVSHSKQRLGDLSKSVPKSNVIGNRPELWEPIFILLSDWYSNCSKCCGSDYSNGCRRISVQKTNGNFYLISSPDSSSVGATGAALLWAHCHCLLPLPPASPFPSNFLSGHQFSYSVSKSWLQRALAQTFTWRT